MTSAQHPFAFVSEEYTVKTCSADMNGLWKPGDILVQMQED